MRHQAPWAGSRLACWLLLASWSALPIPLTAESESVGQLALRQESLTLPGYPLALFSLALDGDEWTDFAAVTAAANWGELGFEETVQLDDLGEVAQSITVLPALFDQRFLRSWRGGPQSLAPAAPDREIPPEVLAIEPDPRGGALLALTDHGVDRWTLVEGEDASFAWESETIVATPSLFSRTQTYLHNFPWLHSSPSSFDRLFLPTAAGLESHALTAEGGVEPVGVLPWPQWPQDPEAPPQWNETILPLPTWVDANEDGREDLLLPHPTLGWKVFAVALQRSDGGLGEAKLRRAPQDEAGEPVFVGDLNEDGRLDVVMAEILDPESDNLRNNMQHAKEPRVDYRIWSGRGGIWAEEPSTAFWASGHTYPDEGEGPWSGGLRDLNADGLLDLIAVRLDFSLWQIARVLTVRSIAVDLHFDVWCQGPEGSFRQAETSHLEAKFKINLKNARPRTHIAFQGDFNGDGAADFLRVEKDHRLAIFLGSPECRFSTAPDLAMELDPVPLGIPRIRLQDVDGDRLTDLAVAYEPTRQEASQASTGTVKLDLYLSGPSWRTAPRS